MQTTRTRQKRIALYGGVTVIAVLVIVGLVYRKELLIEWWLLQASYCDETAGDAALEKLVRARSPRAIRPLLERYEKASAANSDLGNYLKWVEEIVTDRGILSVPYLIERLKNGEFDSRIASMTFLERFGPESSDAVPMLIENLRTDEPWLQLVAAQTLGAIGPGAEDAVDALVMNLSHADPAVAFHAARALLKITSDGKAVEEARRCLERLASEDGNELSVPAQIELEQLIEKAAGSGQPPE